MPPAGKARGPLLSQMSNPLVVRSMKVWEDPKEEADESSDSMATAVQMR